MASIGEVTATLRANTSQFSAGMNDAVAQLRQLGIAAGQATESERAYLIAQQQSIIAGLKKQGLVIINGRLVASETALAEATTVSTVAQERFNQAAGGGMTGVARLERSLASLVTRFTGMPEQVGSIGTSLLRIGTGGIVTLAVIAGIGLLVAAFDSLITKMRAASKEAAEISRNLQNALDTRDLKTQLDAVNQAATDVASAQAKLATLSNQATTTNAAQREFLRRADASAAANGGVANADIFGSPASLAQVRATVNAKDATNTAAVAQARVALGQATLRLAEAERQLVKAREERNKELFPDPKTIEPPKTPPVTPNLLAQQLIEARGQGYLDQMAQQKKALDDQFKQAEAVFREQDQFFRQQGQVLASSLTEGLVNGNLGQTLFDGLKRIFVSVLQRLLEDALINKLVKSLEQLFNITQPTQPTGGGAGGGFLQALGTGLGTVIGGMLLSPGAPQVAAGGATALARGSAAGVTVPLSGMPRALSPVEHARDAQWQYVFSETQRLAGQQGFRMGVS